MCAYRFSMRIEAIPAWQTVWVSDPHILVRALQTRLQLSHRSRQYSVSMLCLKHTMYTHITVHTSSSTRRIPKFPASENPRHRK